MNDVKKSMNLMAYHLSIKFATEYQNFRIFAHFKADSHELVLGTIK